MPTLPPIVPTIPVRMLEAWLLADEGAIRHAAGNPNGSIPLGLPRVRDLERLADPKTRLRRAVEAASGISRRRRDRLHVGPIQVAQRTESFAALRVLPAFRAFEGDVQRVIVEQGWPETLPESP
jgi:hypothetical protein